MSASQSRALGEVEGDVHPVHLIDNADVSTWTVDRLIRERAQTHADRPFMQVLGSPAETYSETYSNARRVATGLRTIGVRQGDAVAVMVRNSMEAVHAWLAINLIGAVEVCVNTANIGHALEHAINLSLAKLIVAEIDLLPALHASAERLPHLRTVIAVGTAPNGIVPSVGTLRVEEYAVLKASNPDEAFKGAQHTDTASIIYTSGTTGPAKGVLMPHAQVMLIAQMTMRYMRLREQDVFYCFTPLYHMSAKFMCVLGTMYAGGHVVLDQTFEPAKWLDRIRECDATVSGGPGTLIEMVYAVPPSRHDRDHRLARIFCAPLPRHIAHDFQSRFGVKGIELWGMTEVGLPCWHSYDESLREGCCGKVSDEWYEMRIVDPQTDRPLGPHQRGEFVVRPKVPWIVSTGYVGMPEKTVAAWRNLWFHTGDIGYMDGEGYVYFIERASERIRRRSENISSYEIELAALKHADIQEAVAVGVPSEYLNDDDIKLCVVPRPETPLNPAALLEHLVQHLPHYMVPRYIEVVQALPRTATNKIARAALKNPPFGTDVWDRKSNGVSIREMTAYP